MNRKLSVSKGYYFSLKLLPFCVRALVWETLAKTTVHARAVLMKKVFAVCVQLDLKERIVRPILIQVNNTIITSLGI